MPVSVEQSVIDQVIEKVRQAKRPVLYAGNGIRLSEGYEAFRSVVEKLGIPVATCWDSIDAIETAHPLYVGVVASWVTVPATLLCRMQILCLLSETVCPFVRSATIGRPGRERRM